HIDKAAGQRELTLERRIFPLDQQHLPERVEDNAIDSQQRRHGARHIVSLRVAVSAIRRRSASVNSRSELLTPPPLSPGPSWQAPAADRLRGALWSCSWQA